MYYIYKGSESTWGKFLGLTCFFAPKVIIFSSLILQWGLQLFSHVLFMSPWHDAVSQIFCDCERQCKVKGQGQDQGPGNSGLTARECLCRRPPVPQQGQSTLRQWTLPPG